MKLHSNVPKIKHFEDENDNSFCINDRVRIQYEAKQKEFPYSGGGIIGHIKDIFHDSFIVTNFWGDKEIQYNEVFIIKRVDEYENFENTPYINDEECEFWRTHWYTKDGLKKKTEEDIKYLEEFHSEYNK